MNRAGPRPEPTLRFARAGVAAAEPLVRMLGHHHPTVKGLGLGLGLDRPDVDPERRLPVTALDALWTALVERDGPTAALELGSRVRASSYGLLTYLLGCAPSGRHALSRLEACYRDLLSEGTRYSVTVERRHVEVDVELVGSARSPSATLFAAASVVGFMASEGLGQPRPRSIDLVTDAPPPVAADSFARFFGGHVRFGTARSRLVYERADLERRLLGSDAALSEILEDAARQRRRAPRPSAKALEEVLLAAPPGEVSQSSAAASLGLSPRSLRRRLAAEGTSFQAVVDMVRSRWAQAQLMIPGMPVTTVARASGYADAAAFRRAFGRWTGASPAAWAAAMGRGLDRNND